MYSLNRTGRTRSTNIWPGFVDALSNLLLVLVFVLMVFMVAQYFLSLALTGKDERLARLDRQIAELADLLALERSANSELRLNVAQLSSELQNSVAARDELSSQLARLGSLREDLEGQINAVTSERDILADRLLIIEEKATEVEAELADAYTVIEADKEKIETQLAELAILKDLRDQMQAELARLERVFAAEQALTADLESEAGRLRQARSNLQSTLDALRQDNTDLLDRLAQQETVAADVERRLAESQEVAREQGELTAEQQLKIDLLNRQLAALRQQIGALNAALEASEARNLEAETQIADLGKRLNAALATKVQELARYRSEFFGRLREVLGDNPNIRIVGDRFVFQSEVLFPSASAALEPGGREQIQRLADTLKEIAEKIPPDLDWVLRVDGHTDRRPISTAAYPSNWELSSARAIEVVKTLIAEGIPPDRLVAAGFGEYQPIAAGESPAAFSRNRRIEFKLTER
jgi:chemotaxis protein MotB